MNIPLIGPSFGLCSNVCDKGVVGDSDINHCEGRVKYRREGKNEDRMTMLVWLIVRWVVGGAEVISVAVMLISS